MLLGYEFVRFPFLSSSPSPARHQIFIYFNFLCLVSVVGRVASDNFARFPAEMAWPLFHTLQHTHHPDRHTHPEHTRTYTHALAHAAQHNCTHNLATAKCVLNVSRPQPPSVDSHAANPSPIQFGVFNKLGAMFSVAICHFVVFI